MRFWNARHKTDEKIVLPTPVFAPYTCKSRSFGHNTEPTCLMAKRETESRCGVVESLSSGTDLINISPRRHRDWPNGSREAVGRTFPRSVKSTKSKITPAFRTFGPNDT